MSEIADRQVLIKYIKEEKYNDAYLFLKDRENSIYWCDRAISIYIFLEKFELANNTLRWVKKNASLLIWRRCIYEYAKASWIKLWGHKPEGLMILPGIPEENKEIFLKLDEVLDVISPVLKHIEGDQAANNELESKILLIAINIYWIKGDIEKVRELSSYLIFMTPASLALANLALLGLVDKKKLNPNFPERLIDDHPESFNALMLSNIMRAEIFNQADEAYLALKDYSASVKEENYERFLDGLIHVAKLIGRNEVKETIKLTNDLLGSSNKLVGLIQAELFLKDGKIEEAEKILCEYEKKDNLIWLQLNAFLQIEKGNFEEALKCYEKSVAANIHPEVLLTFGKIALKASQKDKKFLTKVIDAYRKLIELHPDSIVARHNLSFALLESGEIQKAEEHFKFLSEKSTELIYKQNYAYCLVQRNELNPALEIYNQILENADIPVEVVISTANLLKQIKSPNIAFNFLNEYQNKYWDSPLFLQCYIRTAYQANNDHNSHKAFLQLRKLQSEGKVSPEVIQEKTIDDLKKFIETQNQREKNVCDLYLKGQLPWTFADNSLNRTICNGWFFRTQKLDWISEDPFHIARFSIYSTNGFHPLKKKGGNTYLEFLEKPLPNTEAILDISSIFTLQKLGILPKAINFFKTLYIPSLYISKLSLDSENLIFHQLSNVEAILKIKKAIDDKSINILDDFGAINDRPYPYINEHTIPENDEEHFYRLVDIINVLISKGLIKRQILNEIDKLNLKPSGVDDTHPSVELNGKVVVEISSLKTLCDLEIFNYVIENFTLMITKSSGDLIYSEIIEIQIQEQNHRFNNELRSVLSGEHFKRIDISGSDHELHDFSMASIKLRTLKNVPIFVDCRSLQMIALNDNPDLNAFGIDRFLNALYSNSFIDIEVYTEYYLKLIEWRYKFLFPPIEVINYLAEQYFGSPPGIELNQIAMYIQECMQDPGLFSGQETSAEIPLSISTKLYIAVLKLSTDFIINCWTNDIFSEKEAEKYTEWALLYLLPTFPKFLPEFVKVNMARMTKKVILSDSIMNLITIQHPDISNLILLKLKEKLKLSDTEYNKIVAESLDAIR